jgi:hypothetical protein
MGLVAEANCTWCAAGKYQSGSGVHETFYSCRACNSRTTKSGAPSQIINRPRSWRPKSQAMPQGRCTKLGCFDTVAEGRNRTSDHTITSWARYQLQRAIPTSMYLLSVVGGVREAEPVRRNPESVPERQGLTQSQTRHDRSSSRESQTCLPVLVVVKRTSTNTAKSRPKAFFLDRLSPDDSCLSHACDAAVRLLV